jgi:hypothetical protein
MGLGWGFLAYLWAFINDAPVNADVLLGRSNYFVMEVLLNLASLSCFVVAAWQTHGGGKGRKWPRQAFLWVALAYLWSAADDTPAYLLVPKIMRREDRIYFEIAFYAVSLVFFYLALRDSGDRGAFPGRPKPDQRLPSSIGSLTNCLSSVDPFIARVDAECELITDATSSK